MNATLAQVHPGLPAVSVEYAVVRVGKFFSQNSTVQQTEVVLETIASISYDEENAVMTLSHDETTTILHRISAIEYNCQLHSCVVFVEGWLQLVAGETPKHPHTGAEIDAWGQFVIALEPDECQAPVEHQALRARHRR